MCSYYLHNTHTQQVCRKRGGRGSVRPPVFAPTLLLAPPPSRFSAPMLQIPPGFSDLAASLHNKYTWVPIIAKFRGSKNWILLNVNSENLPQYYCLSIKIHITFGCLLSDVCCHCQDIIFKLHTANIYM